MNTVNNNIVIVEDNANDAELLVNSLNKTGLINSIIVLEDGKQAIDFFYGHGIYKDKPPILLPTMIFLDLKLPKLNGLEVLQKLKTNERTKKIPVVVFTSSNENSDKEAAYKLGANSYIVKPVDFEKFTMTVNQVGLYWLEMNEKLK